MHCLICKTKEVLYIKFNNLCKKSEVDFSHKDIKIYLGKYMEGIVALQI